MSILFTLDVVMRRAQHGFPAKSLWFAEKIAIIVSEIVIVIGFSSEQFIARQFIQSIRLGCSGSWILRV
jgi:hypothetical protein